MADQPDRRRWSVPRRVRGIRFTWAVAVGLPVVVVLAIGGWMLVNMQVQRSDYEAITDDAAEELATIVDAQRELLEAEDPLGGVLYEINRSGTPEQQWVQWLDHQDAIVSHLDWLARILDGGDANALARARNDWDRVVAGVAEARTMWGTGEVGRALAIGEDPFSSSVWAPLERTQFELARLAGTSIDDMQRGAAAAERAQVAAERMFVAALLTVLAVASASAWLLSARIIRPLMALQHAVARIRHGALDEHIEVSRRAGREVEALGEAMAEMADSLRSSHHRLRTQAYTDGLTGLANRRSFTETVEHRAAADPAEIAVLLIDVDDFKAINDSLGHQAGDEVLVHLAGVLRASAREREDLIARLGGDEFAVVVRAADAVGAASSIANRVLGRLDDDLVVSGGAVRVGCSIGIADGRDAATADEIVSRADAAMYMAKRRGKHGVAVFDPSVGEGDESATGGLHEGLDGRSVPDQPWRSTGRSATQVDPERARDDRVGRSDPTHAHR